MSDKLFSETLFALLTLITVSAALPVVAEEKGVNAESYYNMAIYSLKKNKVKESIDLLNRALLESPNNSKYLLRRGRALYVLKEYKSALNDANAVMSTAPANMEALQLAGMCHRMLDDPQAGLAVYNKALKLQPKNAHLHFLLGNLYFGYGKRKEAEQHYLKAVKFNPAQAQYRSARADNLRYMGRYDEALKELDHVLKTQPSNTETLNTKSVTYYVMGRKKEALELLEKAIKIQPNNSKYIFNAAMLKDENGDRAGAMSMLKRAIELDPNNSQALNNLGNLNYINGDLVSARKYFDAAIAADPKHLKAYLNRANLFAKLGHPEEAAADMEEANRIITFDATMGKGIQTVRTPTKAEFKQIIKGYGKIIQMNPHDASSYYNRACAEFCLAEYENAEKDFSNFLTLTSNDKNRSGVFAKIYSYFAASQRTNAPSAVSAKETSVEWPRILLSYLNGSITDTQLFKKAHGTTDSTSCHFVTGMQKLIKKKTNAGIKDLVWVVKYGDRSMDEYMMALCELARLKTAEKEKPLAR